MTSDMLHGRSPLTLLLALCAVTAHAQAGQASRQHSIQAGQQIYLQRCMQCHSTNRDQVMLGPSLYGEMTTSPHRKTAAQIRQQLRDGKGKMPAFKDILTPADIDNLLAYIRTL